MIIRTPDHRLRVFVSSTLKELAEERKAARQAILKLRLAPVMFEAGARPHPAQDLYKSYLSQSQIFIAIYWQSYGWVAPGMSISGLEDEYNLSEKMPRLIYIKKPAPHPEPALTGLLDRIQKDNTSCYTYFSTAQELEELVQNDLALLLSEYFESSQISGQTLHPSVQFPLTNVPVPRNPLIGREKELATVCSMLLRDDIALITLTGAGGTGKSRLAIQIGLEMLEHFEDGVYLVILEPLRDPNLVISTIAGTLGVRETPGSRPIDDILKEYLRNKQMLLLLDNFEQVVAAAPFVGELLETCPRLKILVTSRTPLHIRAEKELPVLPLKVPSLENSSDLSSLSQFAAVELFIQRAQAVQPKFTVTNRNAPAVAEICYRLDGLPLAIELAAARIRLLTPQGILDRLDNRFDLLRGGSRDLPERQRTLRSTIDWSYNLLNESEKKLFLQLSIFVGGFTLEAAETICDIDGDLGQSLDDVLESLIDNNLVIQNQHSEEGSRFGMLSTIHEYGLERLMESIEADSIRSQYDLSRLADYTPSLETYERHCDYYLTFLKHRENSLKSTSQQEAMHQLTDEIDNIRAAWAWAVNHSKFAQLGRAGRAFGWYFEIAGLYRDGIEQLEMLLQTLKASPQSDQWHRVLGLTLLHQALLHLRIGEFERAQELYEESIVVLRPTGDQVLLADALIFLGTILHLGGDYERARSLVEEGLFFARAGNDRWFEAFAVFSLGHIDSLIGRYKQGYEQMLVGIAIWRSLGDPHAIALGLNFLVPTLIKLGRFEEAKSYMQESITLCEGSKNHWGRGTAYRFLGLVCIAEGQFALAQTHLLKSLEIFREFAIGWDIARSLTYLGDTALMSGDFTEARKYYLDALRLSAQAKATPIALDALWGLGKLHAQDGKVERALEICYHILNHPSSEEDTRYRAGQLSEALETELSPRQVKAAQAAVQQKTFDTIVSEVLEIA